MVDSGCPNMDPRTAAAAGAPKDGPEAGGAPKEPGPSCDEPKEGIGGVAETCVVEPKEG